MGINKPVTAVLVILVSVLVVSTVAVPMIEDFTDDVKLSDINDNQRYFAKNTIDKNVKITLDENGNYDINGEKLYLNGSWVISDSAIFNLFNSGISYFENGVKSNGGPGSSIEIKTDNTIVYTSISDPSHPIIKKITNVIYPSVNGNYGYFINVGAMSDYNSTIYFPFGSNSSGGVIGCFAVKNNVLIDDFYPVVNSTGSPLTGEKIIINSEKTTGADIKYSGLTVRFNDNPEMDVTCNTFFAPLEYNTHSTTAIKAIMGIIPILLFIVPVFVAVAALKGRTD